ncbi:MAG: cohesin domain-containing protein, partial [Candidatus Omnitrophica bacterium]|nr:cohesin domain-containing protein [Candidatus Omnitrophota bacterium]
LQAPGAYSIAGLLAGSYYLAAFLDVDDDGHYDVLTEPAGEYANNPVVVAEGSTVNDKNIILQDPNFPQVREVSISSDLKGSPGAIVQVPINIDEGAGVDSFQFVISYDDTVIVDTDVIKGSLLPDDWLVFRLPLEPVTKGTGRVKIIGQGLGNELLPGSGSLAILKFKVKNDAQAGQYTDLSFDDGTNNDTNFLMDSQLGIINGNYTAGKLTVVPSFVLQLKAGGWNLISLPIEPNITNPQALIPNLVSIWEWNGSYIVPTVLQAKKGYWVLVSQDTQVTVEGTRPADNTVHLFSGWNLVGPIENAARPVSANIISAYGWGAPPAGGYQAIGVGQVCNQGSGYWFLATQPTDIWSSP